MLDNYVIGIESYTPGTYEDNLMVKSHSPIAATD